ncbi:molybdopterin oxidoreductase [Catenulispora acidiphila DSM 44928]|uniref:Molybdopterin oxidoreductase n=1 Tax=Catenulispora acidiphila (strain DSM 44928 / JCM 14897 / NBRC 102108 / NRRL B-24433 / ID139908) TaxID=479433 RepID=C7QIF4_CATAD|nr:molybdopterin oxidoreductase family protein [Catenulispora acidiphila]ACU75031.1 molybdopterin oxidoreductase [Catenulispora acidiphila DSM 44928]
MDALSPATRTHCPYCALQCGMELHADAAGTSPLRAAGWDAFQVNRGALCQKGATSTELLNPALRLTAPLLRRTPGAELEPATWDEALDVAAARLTSIAADHGRAAVGVFGGGGLTHEKAYSLGKFARVVLRTPNIDYNGRFCMSAAAAASQRAFGVDRGLPFPLADVAQTDVILLVGSNLADTMPPALRYFTTQRENGGRLIVVDPRRTRTADQADLHLQPVPGTDAALAAGLLHVLIAEHLIDDDFIAARTSGFEEARAEAQRWWPERVEAVCGVPAGDVRAAARMFAGSRGSTGMVLTARGTEQQADGADAVNAWINVALAAGKAGRPYCGYGAITGQGNGQGGREHGQKADQLPGYRKITDPAAREHVAEVWGISPDALPGPGRPAVELLASCGADIRALLVAGSNPVVSAPDAEFVTSRLRELDFLMVSDVVLSETAALADVVFPVTQWAEETGTVTNLEGRVLLRRQAVAPPDGVRSDLDVMGGLAERLGWPGFLTAPAKVFTELALASAGGVADYSGLSHERLDATSEGVGLHWPCPTPDHPGTPRMFLDTFGTPDGLARFVPVACEPAVEEPSVDFPYRLTTGRVLAQYQSGAQTRRVPALNAAEPGPFVQLHPDLAAALAVAEGDPVRVTSRRGTAVAAARISDVIRPDTVFMPFHWAGPGRANVLTRRTTDPVSGMPAFKTAAVRVEAAQ